METTTYVFARLAVGASMFGHGLVRLPKLAAFSNWMVASFAKSILPSGLVLPFSYALPILEFLVGFCLLLGLFTKPAAQIGACLMVLLIFGTTLVENWEAIPSQLFHVAFFIFILRFIENNGFAFDRLFKK